MFRIATIAAVLVVLASCEGRPRRKAPPTLAPPSTESLSVAVAKTAEAARAPVVERGKPHMLGPIDLEATTLDLAALFPGAALSRIPPNEGSFEAIYVKEGRAKDKRVAELELGRARVRRIAVYAPTIIAPNGLHPTMQLSAAAAVIPNATCTADSAIHTMACSDPDAPELVYLFDAADWTNGATGSITTGPGDALLSEIHWIAPDDAGPEVAKRQSIPHVRF